MCRPASMICTLGHKMTWSKTKDSHSEIRREFGMPENSPGRVTSVQVEIVPRDEDYSLPLPQWTFVVDQDTLPDWWDAVEAERQCRLELENWARVRLVRHGEHRDEIVEGELITAICGGTASAIRGGTVSEIWGGTVSEIRGGTVCFFRTFTVKLCGLQTVIVDRTGRKARCIVGTENERTVKSRKP